jgi:hypothetical protein
MLYDVLLRTPVDERSGSDVRNLYNPVAMSLVRDGAILKVICTYGQRQER